MKGEIEMPVNVKKKEKHKIVEGHKDVDQRARDI